MCRQARRCHGLPAAMMHAHRQLLGQQLVEFDTPPGGVRPLLGRMVAIPYYPLSDSMLGGIARLQLDRIGRRIRDNHDATFVYDDAVVDHIESINIAPP